MPTTETTRTRKRNDGIKPSLVAIEQAFNDIVAVHKDDGEIQATIKINKGNVCHFSVAGIRKYK